MEYNPIVQNALEQVWCSPPQDNPIYLTLYKISPIGGYQRFFDLHNERIYLPDNTTSYAVYQIGQVQPKLYGLFDTMRTWSKFSDTMNENFLMADLYGPTGIVIPKTMTYYRWTDRKNLIVLVPYLDKIGIDLNTDTVRLRLNSNYYFKSGAQDANGVADYIWCQGGKMNVTQDIDKIVNDYNTYVSMRGSAVRAWVNGFLVKSLNYATVKLNDLAEFVVDTSIKSVLTYNVSDLLQFTSDLDSRFKYLLKSPKTTAVGETIDFVDDVDVYIRNPDDTLFTPAVFYTQREKDSLRNLTHCDYSVPVDYVQYYSDHNDGFGLLRNLQIVLYIKEGGEHRALVNDNNRIKELYKMGYDDCLRAMVGIDSTVPNWQAATLEKAMYPYVMRADCCDITLDNARDTFGYNSICKQVADSPIFSVDGDPERFEVPYLMRKNSTVYEYDTNGLLIGTYLHTAGSTYLRRSSSTEMVEFVYGAGGIPSNYDIYDKQTVIIPSGVQFRCYMCDWTLYGKSQNNWTDCTGTGAYAYNNGILTWSLDLSIKHVMVRLNTGFLTYTSVMSLNTLGYMVHTIPGTDPKAEAALNYIPYQQYDFWLNGHPLVENVDYIQHKYNVIVLSKSYIAGDGSQDQILTVRANGFCAKDLTRDEPTDYGFVQYGLLSKNSKYDLRDDHVMRVIMGGRLYQTTDLLYRENTLSQGIFNANNGKPYQLRDMVRPIDTVADCDSFAYREEAIATDKIISDYLTARLPETKEPQQPVITGLYPLYSPVMSSMIAAYLNGTFKPWLLLTDYGDQDIMNVCQPFLWMLAFDPTQEVNEVDPEFAIVHPHAFNYFIDLPIEMIIFLQNVNRIYLRNKVKLSHFVRTIQYT